MTKVLFFTQVGTYDVLEVPLSPDAIIASVYQGLAADFLPPYSGSLNASLQAQVVIITPRLMPESIPTIPEIMLKSLRLLAEGKSTKQIALILHRSPRTIRFYFQALRNTFHVQTMPELIKKAHDLGLI